MSVNVKSSEGAMLARLRDAVGADRALAARLAQIADADNFVAAVRDAAAERAIVIAPATIAAELRPDPLGLDRFTLPQATRDDWPDVEWLPVAVVEGAAGPVVEWLHFAGRRLTDPFFEEAVRHARYLPLNRFLPVRTPLARFAETMPADATFTPSGFVFHLSRCGSTLVAQMLAAVPEHVVISEAAPLDAVVQLREAGRLAGDGTAELRAMAAALLRDRHGGRRCGVMKLDCWHMLAWRMFAAAFPTVPFVFLYRDPVEILVSHDRRPGSQMVPGLIPHLCDGLLDRTDPEGFGAGSLGRIADAAADAVAAGRATAVRYDHLPGAVFDDILPAFGMIVTETERAAMQAAGVRDAKAPTTAFTDDRAAKQAEATVQLRARAARHLAPPIARLESV